MGRSLITALVSLWGLWGASSLAETIDQQTPTFFVNATGGYSI